MNSLPAENTFQKQRLRKLGYSARNAQPDKEIASRTICQTVLAMSEYKAAKTILWYVGCRSEVQTFSESPEILTDKDKFIAIPFCTTDQQNNPVLGLWKLQNLDELETGMWSIFEPPRNRWYEAERSIVSQQLDLVIVPGVGFDLSGGRLGNGKGYYDRLLNTLEARVLLVGVGYESQVFDTIPMGENDIYLDVLVTENAVYRCDSAG